MEINYLNHGRPGCRPLFLQLQYRKLFCIQVSSGFICKSNRLYLQSREVKEAEKKYRKVWSVSLVYCENRIVEFYRGSGLVMAADKPRALVFGHSFVRRIGEFIDRNNPEEGYSRDFCLSNICDTSILGIGGRTVDKTIRCDLDTITRNAPNLLILEMGPMMCATAAAMLNPSHYR